MRLGLTREDDGQVHKKSSWDDSAETKAFASMKATRRALLLSQRWNHAYIVIPHCHGWMNQSRSVGSTVWKTTKIPSCHRALSSIPNSPSDLVSSYIVIGNGPIGASVAKHLVSLLAGKNSESTSQQTVTIVDGRPSGMGSSHSDRARLIRTFDAEGNVDWTRWNKRSLEAFREIERSWNSKSSRTRKSFFTRCGALLLGDKEFVERSKTAAEESMSSTSSTQSFSLLSPTECQAKWPYIKPKVGCDVALFDPLGGIIDPLAFISAQNHNAKVRSGNNGSIRLEIRSDIVATIQKGAVELASGEVLTATEKIILCGGAYSQSLLDNSGIVSSSSTTSEFSPRASKRTVALLEVSEESVAGILKDMPTIKYAFGLAESSTETNTAAAIGEHSRVEAGSAYLLPPVCYPEKGGKWFVKIGGGANDFFDKDDKKLLDDWLSSDGDPSSAEWLGDIGKSLLSGVHFESLQSMACVTTTTSASKSNHGVLVDDVLGDGSLIAVSACQGKGAGPSDALGAYIVQQIMQQTFLTELLDHVETLEKN